jgi:hypothetical protein
MRSTTLERLRASASLSFTSIVIIVLSFAASVIAVRLIGPSVHSRYFLWISGRALGLAAYTTLWLLVLVGTWMRHPWRTRLRLGHPETRLRVHAALAVATISLVACHVAVLALDSYAGVGWKGVVIPGAATYRPVAVALGTVALATLLLLTASASLAGRRGTRHWLLVHRLGAANFAMVWLHGVLAGTDGAALRLFYAASGLVWLLLVTTRLGGARDTGGVEHATTVNNLRPLVASSSRDPRVTQ